MPAIWNEVMAQFSIRHINLFIRELAVECSPLMQTIINKLTLRKTEGVGRNRFWYLWNLTLLTRLQMSSPMTKQKFPWVNNSTINEILRILKFFCMPNTKLNLLSNWQKLTADDSIKTACRKFRFKLMRGSNSMEELTSPRTRCVHKHLIQSKTAIYI